MKRSWSRESEERKGRKSVSMRVCVVEGGRDVRLGMREKGRDSKSSGRDLMRSSSGSDMIARLVVVVVVEAGLAGSGGGDGGGDEGSLWWIGLGAR